MIYDLICHTSGCENDGITIRLETTATVFYCGPCGVEITDKKVVS
jgi:predicted RNA-binding Zn-ribbon protein involved in translation (DUF1610 family)